MTRPLRNTIQLLVASWLTVSGLRVLGVIDNGPDWIDAISLVVAYFCGWLFIAFGVLRDREASQ